MGLFWDLIQHQQISNQSTRADSLEERVRLLERQLEGTNQLLRELMMRLEQRLGEDIDRDGKIG